MHKSDPNRVTNKDALDDAKKMAAYLVEQRGTRGAAALLHWTMADISRIARGRWGEIKLYPEHIAALKLAHDIVERDTYLRDEARAMLIELSAEFGGVTKKITALRRVLRKL